MSPHPLDISHILRSQGVPTPPQSKKDQKNSTKDRSKGHIPAVPSFSKPISPRQPKDLQGFEGPKDLSANSEPIKIEPEYWKALNEESRRMLTSRIWKGIDFNPMLRELDDLSKLTEKWLRWAVPTFVNGLQSGPIKNWLNGEREGRDFHYVLVGEHLKHLKEMREHKKQALSQSSSEVSATTNHKALPQEEAPLLSEAVPGSSEHDELKEPSETQPSTQAPPLTEDMARAIEKLDEHIEWFRQYLQQKD